MIGLSAKVLEEIEGAYIKDQHLRLIYEKLKKKLDADSPPPTETVSDIVTFSELRKDHPGDGMVRYQGFHAKYCNGHVLLYMTDCVDNHHRLCIPNSCHKKFFEAVHDGSNHAGYHKCYNRLRTNYYIPNLSRLLRKYIAECPACAVNTNTHHKPYGRLQPLQTPELPFEFITIDHIFKLLASTFDNNTYDGIMTCMDKLTRMVTLIPGRETYSAEDWARSFFYTYCRRWGVPSRILTDRGKVFLSEFWKSLFKMMRTDLLVTTAYHPQTDGQSERTNQTVEVALRYLVNVRRADWAECLPEVEFHINNTINASTSVSPMEYLTGINARTVDVTILPSTAPALENWSQRRETIRLESRDAITYAQAKMAIYYDQQHQPVSFKPGQKVYVNLQKDIGVPGYRLPNDHVVRKLGPRRVGPFRVIPKIGDLVYELDLPSNWKIHKVISVAHLEPAKDDTYERVTAPVPEIVYDAEGHHEEWEVEEILRSRWRDRRRKRNKEYYIKWKGYGPEHNEWVLADDLKNAPDLIRAFEAITPTVAFITTIVPLPGSYLSSWSTNVGCP